MSVDLVLVLVLVLVLDLFFELFGLPTCIPSDPVYPVVMCITTTNALPSRNPNDCPGCSGGDGVLCDAVHWTALARLTLCDECRITVRGYIEEEGGLDPAYAYED